MVHNTELIEKKVVLSAVKALRESTQVYSETRKKKPLLDDESDSAVFLQVQLKKIPKTKNIQRIRVKLPHSLVDENTDICFISGDLDKKNHKAEIEPDKLHYKELFNKHNINNISEVITLRQLRTEYKPYEAKLKLLSAYDIFLADNKIIECLPRVLGKHFFKKRKFPLGVDMKPSILKSQIDKALSTVVFHISGHGNSCASEVGKLKMEGKEITENVFAYIQALSDHLPGSFDNVMGLYLKTKQSKALPIYVSFGNPNKVDIPEEVQDSDFEKDELTTIPTHNVKVYRDGTIKLVKNEDEPDEDYEDIPHLLEQFTQEGSFTKGIKRKLQTDIVDNYGTVSTNVSRKKLKVEEEVVKPNKPQKKSKLLKNAEDYSEKKKRKIAENESIKKDKSLRLSKVKEVMQPNGDTPKKLLRKEQTIKKSKLLKNAEDYSKKKKRKIAENESIKKDKSLRLSKVKKVMQPNGDTPKKLLRKEQTIKKVKKEKCQAK